MRRAARGYGGPDPEGEFVRAAADRDGVPPDWILPGNGSLELIHQVCRAVLKPRDRAAILGPTFGEFGLAARASGAITAEFLAGEDNGFRWDTAATVRFISAIRPAVLFLCNPNNPTGTYLIRTEVAAIREAVGEGLLILDEAYADFLDERWSIPPDWFAKGRLIVLRSVSKICAMQYLGLGYAVARPDVLAPAMEALAPARLNPVTAAGGAVYLKDPSIAGTVRAIVGEGKRLLTGGLSRLGFSVITGAANYIMVRVGNARNARWELLRRGILVKDLVSYGLPEYLRVAIPAPAEVQRVLKAFADLGRVNG
jgi:histidinol-phosphate aminotransferase